jgi:D-glycero-D-manno-heptose 1,7-bisphosphate phosphatase
MKRRFVILDRDGTINIHKNYISDPDEIELIPGAAEGLRLMKKLGLGLIVITNQSAVGRGYFDLTRLDEINQRLIDLLYAENILLDGIYYCPHTPEDQCDCRKPKPALVEKAAVELGFNPSASFVIGDNICDIELGKNIEATTILVRSGYGDSIARGGVITPDFIAVDLVSAAQFIGDFILKEERNYGITKPG